MTDPIGTAQERELIERVRAETLAEAAEKARGWIIWVLKGQEGRERVADRVAERILALNKGKHADALQSRIAEVGRLEALLAEAATELDGMAQAVIDAAAKVGVPTKYAGRKVTSETADRIRAALSLQRRV